jgi:hypothetical protein
MKMPRSDKLAPMHRASARVAKARRRRETATDGQPGRVENGGIGLWVFMDEFERKRAARRFGWCARPDSWAQRWTVSIVQANFYVVDALRHIAAVYGVPKRYKFGSATLWRPTSVRDRVMRWLAARLCAHRLPFDCFARLRYRPGDAWHARWAAGQHARWRRVRGR